MNVLYNFNTSISTKCGKNQRIAYPVYNKNDVIGTGSLSDGRYIFVGDTYSGYSEFSGKYNCYPHSIYILDPVSQKFKLVSKMVTTETTKEKKEKDNGVALIRNYDASASCFG